METRASVVIIGAGIVGSAAAHFLSDMGWRDVVVVDQGPLFATGGSTSHAPGLVFQTNGSKTMTQFARETVALFASLEHRWATVLVWRRQSRGGDHSRALGGPAPQAGLGKELGDRRLAADPGRDQSQARPDRRVEDPRRLLRADGRRRQTGLGRRGAGASRRAASTFHARTAVVGIETERGRVRAVVTTNGRIETERVLVCCGIWGPRIGRMVGVPIPLAPVEHQLAWTTPAAGAGRRDRRDRAADPARTRTRISTSGSGATTTPSAGTVTSRWSSMPATSARTARRTTCRPPTRSMPRRSSRPGRRRSSWSRRCGRSRSPAPSTGCSRSRRTGSRCSGSRTGCAASGWPRRSGSPMPAARRKAVAQLMTDGRADLDLRECDVNRFDAYAATDAYVRERGAQQYREVYDVIHPLQPLEQPRPLRRSPFYAAAARSGGRLFREPRLGGASLVRGERAPGRSLRDPAACGLGWQILVADRRRRASGDPRARRALRHDAAAQDRGHGSRRRRSGWRV